MSDSKELQPADQKDYDAIELAVKETARGRWFLEEYARRNRHADTLMLLEAFKKLEASLGDDGVSETEPAKIKFDLMEMASAIAQTKNEIAAISPSENGDSHINTATQELDAIVEATETATSDILGAAEQIQETAWTMRESGIDGTYCDALDDKTTEIYTACSFQDITGQRINKVVATMKYLENRLAAMIDIWGGDNVITATTPIQPADARPDAHLLNGPQLGGEGNEQDDIDLMFVEHSANTSPDATISEPETVDPDATEAPSPKTEPEVSEHEEMVVAEPEAVPEEAAPEETTPEETAPFENGAAALATLDRDDKNALFS